MKLLKQHDRTQESILGQEIRSLIYELHEDYAAAIKHRLREIALIDVLWKHAATMKPELQASILDRYQPLDLADRYDLLAILYHDSGQLKKAIQALWKSREICEEHGVKFDSTDLLKEYLQELRGPVKAKKKK